MGEWVDDQPKSAIYTQLETGNGLDINKKKINDFPTLHIKDQVNMVKEIFSQIRSERMVYRIKNSHYSSLFESSQLAVFENVLNGKDYLCFSVCLEALKLLGYERGMVEVQEAASLFEVDEETLQPESIYRICALLMMQ